MFSLRLAQSIQDHWEQIASDTIQRIRQDQDVPHMAKLRDVELRNWVRGILDTIQFWPSDGVGQKNAERFQRLGRHRFETAIPLEEAVCCLHILKSKLFDFTRSRGFAQSPIEVYAQEELEHQVGLFFDRLVFYAVRGYEEARRRSGQAAV